MRKLIATLMVGVLVLSLSACGKKETDKLTDDTSMTQEVTETGEPEVTEEPEVTDEAGETTDTTGIETTEIDYENAKLVALTFDDGPSVGTTPKVLDCLEKYGVVATFFLIGQNVSETTKPIMERQLELGCEIANHSYTHQQMSGFTAEDIKDEIAKTNEKINNLVGVTPKFFRPPYINVSNTMHENIDLPFICGIMANDWVATTDAETRATTIINNVKDGDIILLHDFNGNDLTVQALDTIIPELLDQGYVFVTVSDLFKYKNVDPNKKYTVWTNTAQ